MDAYYLCEFVPLVKLHALLNMFDITSGFSIAMIICVCIGLILTIYEYKMLTPNSAI